MEFLHLFADWDPVETCIEPAGRTYLRTDVEQTDLFQDLHTCTQIYRLNAHTLLLVSTSEIILRRK